MNDIEKILIEMLEMFKAQDAADDSEIKNQENSIKCANSIILDRKKEKEDRKANFAQFQALLDAVKSKAENDCEALAEFYISDRSDVAIERFTGATGIGLPDESEPSINKEAG